MAQPSPFADIPPDKQNDFRFLLERTYQALARENEVFVNAIKGKIGTQEAKIQTLEEAVRGLEICPCNKRHNPGEKCPLFILENEVMRNKWRNRGIYIGCFTSGMVFYYLAQLAIALFKAV